LTDWTDLTKSKLTAGYQVTLVVYLAQKYYKKTVRPPLRAFKANFKALNVKTRRIALEYTADFKCLIHLKFCGGGGFNTVYAYVSPFALQMVLWGYVQGGNTTMPHLTAGHCLILPNCYRCN
jgi:hypothetical protein